jgi:hypothetical protein
MSQLSPQPKQSNTLRNVLLGCLAVFVLVLGVGGFFAYRFIYQPARNAFANVMELENLTKLNEDIRSRVDFVAPEGNLLTQEQVDRFMNVQQGMRETLQGTFTQLEQKYKDIEAQTQNQAMNIRQLFGAYSDLFKLIVEAKRVQVQQLNEYGFSLPEYQWVKEQVLGASGLPMAGFDLSQLMNEGAETVQRVIENVPQQNVDLLAPYKENIEENLAFSFFGL